MWIWIFCLLCSFGKWPFYLHGSKTKIPCYFIYSYEKSVKNKNNFSITSSLVVWSLVVKYVWKPASPITDHIEKKQISVTITLNGASLTISMNSSSFSFPTAFRQLREYCESQWSGNEREIETKIETDKNTNNKQSVLMKFTLKYIYIYNMNAWLT